MPTLVLASVLTLMLPSASGQTMQPESSLAVALIQQTMGGMAPCAYQDAQEMGLVLASLGSM